MRTWGATVYPSQRAPGPASLVLLLPTSLPRLHSGHSGFGVLLALGHTKLTPTSGPLRVPFPMECYAPGLCKPDTSTKSQLKCHLLPAGFLSTPRSWCPAPSPRHSTSSQDDFLCRYYYLLNIPSQHLLNTDSVLGKLLSTLHAHLMVI